MYNNYQGARYQKKAVCQPLSQKEIEYLKKGSQNFSMSVSTEDALKSKCTHKDPTTGENAIVSDMTPTGERFYCSICGTEFNFITDPEILQKYLKNAIDALESIKYMGSNFSPKFVSDFFVITALLKKAELLINPAVKQYMSILEEPGSVNYRPGYNEDPFSMLNNIGGGYYPYNQQPQYNQTPQYPPQQPQQYPQQNPQYAQQPPQNDFNMEFKSPFNNPMGYTEDHVNPNSNESVVPPTASTPPHTPVPTDDNREEVTERITV